MENRDTRSLKDLFGELSVETRTLIRQEMALARTELVEKMVRIAKDFAVIGVGIVILFCGFLTLIAAMVAGLAVFIPVWLSALIISLLFVLAGMALAQKGRKDLNHVQMKPEQTTETFKETALWAKSHVKTAR